MYKAKHTKSLFEQGTVSKQKFSDRISFDEIIEIYNETWQDNWFDNKSEHDEYFKRGKEQLKSYYTLHGDDVTLPISLEQDFSIKLKEGIIKGRVDRIDQHEDSIEIIDYKTGRPKTIQKITKDEKMQLMIYELALRQKDLYKHSTFVLSFYYLTDNSKVTFTASPGELATLEKSLNEKMSDVKVSDFTATPSKQTCGTCDFRDICQFRA